MVLDIYNQYGKESTNLADEVNNFSLLINCHLPVNVYLHGT